VRGAKRRVWRQIYLGIDAQTLEVRAVEVTGSNIGDPPMLPERLNQIPGDQQIGSVTAPSHGLQTNHCRAVEAKHGWRHRPERCALRLMARDFDRQVAEVQVRIAVLNGNTALGIPVKKTVG